LTGHIPPPEFLISYTLVQYQNKVTQIYDRLDLIMVLTAMGGVIAILQSASAAIVDRAADYTLTKDMMTKLYSMNKTKMKLIDSDPDLMDSLPSNKAILLKNLKKRKNYNFDANYFFYRHLCCCCVCIRRSLAERLYLKGRNQLLAEIDLLHILKQLRTANFMSEVFLKPHQPKLIRWFAKYKVSLTKQEQERKRPDFAVVRNDSQSFDPNAVDAPNQNLNEDKADSSTLVDKDDEDSSSLSSDNELQNVDGPPS